MTQTKHINSTYAHELVQQYAKHEIADVLEAAQPYLVYGEAGICWRVPLALKHPITHQVEAIDHIDVEISTGFVHITEDMIQQLRLKAYDLFKAHLLYNITI